MSSPHPIITFFRGGRDYRGRTLTQILSWTDEELEYHHDYVQTLFPLPERSGITFSAPIVDREVFETFRNDEQLRAELKRAWIRIMGFYGFKLQEDNGKDLKVTVSPLFPKNSQNWLCRFDHNHLRITRIIRCLRVLGLEDEASAFHAAIKHVSEGIVGATTIAFWDRAMFSTLNNAPEEKRPGPEKGLRFLVEWEKFKNANGS
ncbi:hypothetical protein BP6252_10554 [Coleophoma cylindrospora]|uniref:Opioid growth factor receptor (OGFr) conserved domain-containing protein n=1 Tax=Coleophoma cylindrospora TaxID=1849047 RepID=A0A3D8QSW4_9HELO|nr:hypothetical protein BP6252_10554 [Coleophoma cylindrospora]